MASHTHAQNSHTHGFGANQSGAAVHATGGGGYNVGFNNQGFGEMMFYRNPDLATATNQYSGGNTPFNVIQPTRTALIVIKT